DKLVTGVQTCALPIYMLSWATTSLIADGRSQSDIRQGVTCEVFGEGWSLGPVNETMRREQTEQQGDIKYDITWTTLAEALDTVRSEERRVGNVWNARG